MWTRVLITDCARRLFPGLTRLLCSAFISALITTMAAGGTLIRAQEGAQGSSAFDVNASEIVANIIAERWSDVRALFDPAMLDAMSEDDLANSWRTYQELLGTFQSA